MINMCWDLNLTIRRIIMYNNILQNQHILQTRKKKHNQELLSKVVGTYHTFVALSCLFSHPYTTSFLVDQVTQDSKKINILEKYYIHCSRLSIVKPPIKYYTTLQHQAWKFVFHTMYQHQTVHCPSCNNKQVTQIVHQMLQTSTLIATCVKQQGTNPDCKFRQHVPMTSKTLQN